MNLNSLMNKLHYVSNLVKYEGLHILSVTETLLTNACDSSFVQLPSFNFYRGDVVGNIRKHGAGLYVSSTIKHVEVLVNLPNVAVVHLVDFQVFVVSVYRPPSSSSAENSTLQDFLKSFSVGRE